MSKKPLGELMTRAKLALRDAVLVGIASSANSPNAAYELAYIETGDVKKSQSCRHLAMIKRDHGRADFETAVSSANSNRPRPTGAPDKSQGEKAMPKTTSAKSPKASSKEEKPANLPLKGIDYRAAVNGVFARVRSIQVFENDAKGPVEAVYVFPLPDEASVVACKMQIGKRMIEAELKEREEARRQYDQAVQSGHHGSLLEQERPNIFTMNVGGIEPGEKITVSVDYVQRIPWIAGGGRFTIPLVVAPRFVPGVPLGKNGGGWSEDTTEVPDASRITPQVSRAGVSYDAKVAISFSPGFRTKVCCPSHPTLIKERIFKKGELAELATGKILTDRDFTLVYESLSDVPEVAKHIGTFGDESFLVATVLPPGNAKPVASDAVLVLDCSGSMSGAAIEGLRLVAKKVIRKLRESGVGHRVGILPFNNSPLQECPIGDPNEGVENFISGLHASGTTMIGLALERAKAMLHDSSRPKVILLVTDGQSEHGLSWRGDGVRLISVGISCAINDTRIKDLARENSGTYEAIFPGEDYDAVASRLAGYLSGPVLSSVSVSSGEAVGVSDVFEGRPATIAVRFSKKQKPSFKIVGDGPKGKKLTWFIDASDAKECDFAAKVWAREFIREHSDKEAQLAASLKYGVICKHTAYVAISLKAKPGGKPERVEIPVNLPSGWDYEAVFGGAVGALGAKGLFANRVGMAPRSLSRGFAPADELIATTLSSTHNCFPPDDDDDILFPRRPRPVFPPVPQDPSVPSVLVSSRFRLDAKDPVDRLVAILVAVLRGNRAGAEKVWQEIWSQPRVVEVVGKWDVTHKAMAFYFVGRLLKHGFKLKPELFSLLSVGPKAIRSDLAAAWGCLGLREFGVAAPAVLPDENLPDYVYLAWKVGRGEKPTVGDWAIVP